MIRGFGPARPRMIAAVHTNAIADTVAFAAGGTPVRLCSDEAQLDECFEASRAPLIVTELGRQLSPVMLSRIMSAARSPIIAVLPTGQLPTSQILSLALSGARFELVHDLSELSAAIRLAGTFPLNSEIGDVARTIAWRMDRESLEDVMGLMILGRRRTTIREALARLDRTAALRTSMRERALPAPARLLSWGAALHIIWQMERYARDFADLSRQLGFSSSRHCSDAFKAQTGQAPMNVMRGAGFDGMLNEFARRLGAGNDVPAMSTSLRTMEYLRICA